MNVDFHTHTLASDGALSPEELMQRAADNGVEMLAITDHDTLDAYPLTSPSLSMRLVSGIELSTEWNGIGIHVVGLNFSLTAPSMREAVRFQTEARKMRAEMIAQRLIKRGVPVNLSAVQQLAGKEAAGRPHFAQHLVELGVVKEEAEAFDKWLGRGKIGDVKQSWASLEQVIHWLRDAGGVAVLAHPLKYKLTSMKLKRLLQTFHGLGGNGLEVISGRQAPEVTRDVAKLAEQFDLMASVGSDFHRPDLAWSEVGKVDPLPDFSRPIWAAF